MKKKNKELETILECESRLFVAERITGAVILMALAFGIPFFNKYGSLKNAYNEIKTGISYEIQKASNAPWEALYK